MKINKMNTAAETHQLEQLARDITSWIKDYIESTGRKGAVIGISGGVDSAVVSTLCARTGLKLLCLEMPIHQGKSQVSRAKDHIEWLKDEFVNVSSANIDLSQTYNVIASRYGDFSDGLEAGSGLERVSEDKFNFVLGNTRSRMRMMTLYQFAGMYDLLVAGTGNKIEDFGIGFFTKGGDQIVDFSPIADLLKTEVWELAEYLGVSKDIVNAAPTDGLHEDGRTDEQAIGATYQELEWAMEYYDKNANDINLDIHNYQNCTEREKEVMKIYLGMHRANQHKMQPIPVFKRKKK